MKRIALMSLLLTVCSTGRPEPVLAMDAGQLRIPTVTRLVQQFTAFENSLIESIRKQDPTALQKLLADDFEMRVGANPGIPTPRAEWIRLSFNDSVALAGVEQMAVHDFGNIAVVSFLGRREAAGDLFIVDVWVRIKDSWRLSTRYASATGDHHFIIPGATPEAPSVEKKY